MNTSNLEKYKVDHLFLLVGKNPLPNYVVAKSGALLRPEGKLYLVYTSDTRKYADTLRDMLNLTNDELVPLESYDANAYEIKNRITSKAKDLKGRLGLNYTGGTKAMSVNAYLAILSIERSEKPVFSYLDPRRLKLCIDREDQKPFDAEISLELTLQDVFKLHQLSLMQDPITMPILIDLAQSIAEVSKEWRNWCDKVLYAEAKRKKDNGDLCWKTKEQLKTLSIPLVGLPIGLIEILVHKGFTTPECYLSLKQIQEKENISFSEPKKVCEWLDGLWLEHYLLEQIKNISREYGMTFKVPITQIGSDFEFDVAFMRNYQLFAFSCTSDAKKPLCKSKLFEAYLRAKQLGGDEARIALVCCSDEPDVLKAELEVAIEDPKINVFGRKHLADLPGAILNWIEELELKTK